MYPCERCAVQIIQAGIKEVIIPNSVPEEFYAKWKDNIETALSMFKEAQVPFWKV
jgi:deoxycytidylate deaminase